jgi:hypothetical protein
MELEILILRKATEYASLKMLMEIRGIDPVRIYKSIMFYRIREAEGFIFFKEGRGYVCGRIGSHLGFFNVNTILF